MNASFLRWIRPKIAQAKEKKKRKTRGKKAMVAVSVFIIIGYSLEYFMNDKKNWSREEVYFGSNVSILSLV